jgi:hypothetical protein
MYQNFSDRPKRYLTASAKSSMDKAFKDEFGDEFTVEKITHEMDGIDDLEDLASTEVEVPGFPFLIFSFAFVLDIFDIADFSGIGWAIMVIIEIIFTVIVFLWMRHKLSIMFKFGARKIFRGNRLAKGSRKRGSSFAQKFLTNFAEKYFVKFMSRRLVAFLIVNIIPLIGILSSMAFFVFLAHSRQKKMAEKFTITIEAAGRILKRIDRQRAKSLNQ